MSENELLSCPFCGGEAIKSAEDLFAANTCNKYVWCKKCGTTSGLQYDYEFAAAAWNRRADMGMLVEVRDFLRDMHALPRVPVVAASVALHERIEAIISKAQAHNA